MMNIKNETKTHLKMDDNNKKKCNYYFFSF